MGTTSNIIYKELISPLGFDVQENFSAIERGDTGLRADHSPFLKKGTFTATISEETIDVRFSEYENPRYYSKLEKLSILLIGKVLRKTGIDPKNERTLLVYSTTKGNIDLMDSKSPHIPEKRIQLVEFKNVLQRYFGFANAPLIVSNACVSGVQATILANDLVKNDLYDTIIVVGGDLVSRFTLSGFSALNALSYTKCKPFDEKRDGINLGECCAALVVSSKIEPNQGIARIAASSSTTDAHHTVAPSREGVGLTRAIKNCLAQRDQTDIDFISAHGTATRYNDEMEALAIHKNNLNDVPLNSLKGYFGHTLGAAGILETVLSLESLQKGQTIASLGFTNLGVSSKVNVLHRSNKKNMKCFLKTAAGFGGVNSAMLIQKL